MAKFSTTILLLAIATISSTYECATLKYYITPTPPPNPACPNDGHPCYTLEQYKQNDSQYLMTRGNLTLVFLEGVHYVNRTFFLRDYDNLIITTARVDNDTHTKTVIKFLHVAGNHQFQILNVVYLKLEDVKFTFLRENTSGIFIQNTSNILLRKLQATQSIIQIHPPKILQQLNSLTSAATVKIELCTLYRSGITVRVKSSKVSFIHIQVNITKCTFIRSVFSGLYMHSEGGSLSNPHNINVAITDSNFTSTIYEYSVISLKIFPTPGLIGTLNIHNCLINQSDDSGVRINVPSQHGRDTRIGRIELNIKQTVIAFHRKSAVEIINKNNNDSQGIVTVHLEACRLYKNAVDSVYLNHGRYLINWTVQINIYQTVITMNKRRGVACIGVSKKVVVNITDSGISHNGNTGIFLQGTPNVNIKNTTISFNGDGGMICLLKNRYVDSNVSIHNCTVSNNYLKSFASRAREDKTSAAGLTLSSSKDRTFVSIKNVIFVQNHDHSAQPVILQILDSKRVIVEDCEFRDNQGTPIQAYFSDVTLSGELLFSGNNAFRGGGLSLLHSRIFAPSNTYINFTGNRAETVGGAIFIDRPSKILDRRTTEKCFYELSSVKARSYLNKLAVSIDFYTNTAGRGGEDIYGASLKSYCIVCTLPSGDEVRSRKVKNVFKFHTIAKSYSSSISSDPTRVCLCDDNGFPQCINILYILLEQIRFPGERFNLSVVLVGYEFGTVSGTVYGGLLKTAQSNHTLDTNQQSQEVDFKKCNQLEYSIHSDKQQETLILTAEKVTIDEYADVVSLKGNIEGSKKQHEITSAKVYITPIFVNVTLEKCPIGFNLSHDTLSCTCISALVHVGVTNCEIIDHTGRVHRSGTIWLAASLNENGSDHGVLIHETCPYHYCKEQIVPTDLRYPDVQCALNHSGILCGGCLPNLSLALGSNQCLSCSNNNHLALLLFFPAAGFLLVLFIKVLDLTVANGTINGLIFYANIVWAYESILFPAQWKEQSAITFLRAFLAWINLDFGIETCFFSGLTAYWKTWLQFVFPIYIWVIVGFMIITSNYFTLAAKIFGNNSVPVLATLFLLSYAKLVRTIITVLGFAVLHYPNHTSIVWSFDGNLAYFGLEHSFILVAALLALFLLWLPYVSTLLLVPWLKRKSYLKPLRWINRWKPFYDAYYGPFKDKHHYWVGLSLIIRGFLLVTFSITSATYPNLNILAMILTPTLLLLYTSYVGNVYKNKLLSLFENSSLVNLIFLGSGVFYVKTFDGNKATIVQMSLWITFTQFVCVLIFHFWRLAKKYNCVCRSVQNRPPPETNQSQSDLRVPITDSAQLRECLLEEN